MRTKVEEKKGEGREEERVCNCNLLSLPASDGKDLKKKGGKGRRSGSYRWGVLTVE